MNTRLLRIIGTVFLLDFILRVIIPSFIGISEKNAISHRIAAPPVPIPIEEVAVKAPGLAEIGIPLFLMLVAFVLFAIIGRQLQRRNERTSQVIRGETHVLFRKAGLSSRLNFI